MKKLHLLCNAHLDPAWLWRWNEGLAEAISTFRVAADFCEQYDGFVFNHNEALLYEWIETHDPQLFARIRRLVREKKWVIMGGWYLQPDCVMTSGESLFAQIELGREYFLNKFGVTPTTAINFDPFGHSRGLVQILSKSGYDSYIFMRPNGRFEGDFLWEGYDGSRVKAHGLWGGYNTLKGEALNKIHWQIHEDPRDTALCLWGIGNHGGGPSKIDLENIGSFMRESDVEILHSTAENYIADVDGSSLPVVRQSLIPCMVGCYTSMVRIKQANRHLENKVAITEKIMSYADMVSDYVFDKEALTKVKKALAFCQFHDILPGSGIKSVEEDGLRTFSYGEEIADRLFMKAFFKLCAGQKKAKDGEIPILAFNPHPYEIEGDFEVEFMLQNQNWNEDEQTFAEVYDGNGTALPVQNEKPQCTFNLDWIQKISFHGKIAPSSISRFDCRLTVKKKGEIPSKEYDSQFITVVNDRMKVSISRQTGLIETYEIDGVPILQNSGCIEVYRDNEDPWGMTVDSFRDYEGSFSLMGDEEANEFVGYRDMAIPNVRIVEDGGVRTKVQAFFTYRRSAAVVEYTIPKHGTYMDVDILLYSNEPNRMLKYRIDTLFSGKPVGETAFGEEILYDDEREAVYHKWCGIRGETQSLYVLNRGTYGGSFTDRTLRLSLLRTPLYAAHPINQRQIAPHDRWIDHVDMGERRFAFRITTGENIYRQAQAYNEEPYFLSFFPSGEGEKPDSVIQIDNPDVLLSSIRKKNDGYCLTLYNSKDAHNDAVITMPGRNQKVSLSFEKFEIKMITLE